jgi:ribosomal protein S18 acetylase RimI-like enzyme
VRVVRGRAVVLRCAAQEHYQFALELYLSTMRPYTEELMAWDEARQRDSFAAQWIRDEVRIIAADGIDIGWLQVSEGPAEIHLQFFIAPAEQRAGIGTKVLNDLLVAWKSTGKSIVLTVLKNNPAKRLYERAGFSVVGDVGVKYEMKCDG